MVIRILNGRGNALYYLEEYPKCVESYHKAMVINPKGVQGKTLYNMGTAYAEMQRFGDAIKCFEQAIPRGLEVVARRLPLLAGGDAGHLCAGGDDAARDKLIRAAQPGRLCALADRLGSNGRLHRRADLADHLKAVCGRDVPLRLLVG